MSESALGKASSGNGGGDDISVDCSACGESISRRPYEIERNTTGRFFCDKSCMGDYQSTHQQVECDYCGDEMSLPEWDIERSEHHFCSDECFNNWQSEYRRGENHPHWDGDNVDVECGYCGSEMAVRPWRLEDVDEVFCSDECVRTWHSETYRGENTGAWKGGHRKYRGPNWYCQREITRRRDDRECVICGKGKAEIGRNPDVHHITRFGDFDSYREANRLANLITLCPYHHGKSESGVIEKDTLYDLIPNKMELSHFE